MLSALPKARESLATKDIADWFRQAPADRGVAARIPSKSSWKAPLQHDRPLHRQRDKIENMLGGLNDRRRIHARYARYARTLMSAIRIAAAAISGSINES